MSDKYRALHTQNMIFEYGKVETVAASSNKVPLVTVDNKIIEWKVKGLIFSKVTKFIYNPNMSNDDVIIYQQEDDQNVTMQIFGKNLITGAVVKKDLDAFGNSYVEYWYDLSLIG